MVSIGVCPRRVHGEIWPGFLMLLILSIATHRSDGKCAFPAIFNFGDSNSDTGGFWAAFPAQPGPFGMTYFKKPSGRASDGRLIIDFMAQALGLPFLSPYLQSVGTNFRHGANFATLASTVLLPNTSLFVTGISPFSLAIQLNQLKELQTRALELSGSFELSHQVASMYLCRLTTLLHHLGRLHLLEVCLCIRVGRSGLNCGNWLSGRGWINELSPGQLPTTNIFERSLYIFYIGQNDFTCNLATAGIDEVKKQLPQVVSQISSAIMELYEIGGRTFMVFNLAPIGCYPAFLTELPHNKSDLDMYGCMISYNNAVDYYNSLLKEKLRLTREQIHDASIVYVDTHSVMLELFRRPKEHGLRYGTKACCGFGGGSYNFDQRVFCGNSKVINGRNVTATACADPENYVSWDGIHATEAANKIVTQAILNGSYFDPPFPLSKLCHLRPIG